MAIPFTFRNSVIDNAMAKTWDILDRYHAPFCSVSGGSDSDVMLDLVYRMDDSHRVTYRWYNTGLEYSATKRHLDFLEAKYDITIERVPAVKSIPTCIREHGVPFLSKFVSQQIDALQHYGFDFRIHSVDDDLHDFPNCKSAIEWWHNLHTIHQWNVSRNKLLREFLVSHPPSFRISAKCCYYAKKRTSEVAYHSGQNDLCMLGVRRSEGGIRAFGRNCFTSSERNGNVFRPLFWFLDSDKKAYEDIYDIQHSECYTRYGLTRTGCVGCPFNPNVEHELLLVEGHESGLVNAARSLFAQSYEYTHEYRRFKASIMVKQA